MRPAARSLVRIGSLAVAVLAVGYCSRSCLLSFVFFGDDAEHEAALAEYWRGHERFDAGDYLAAIPHYDVYRQLLRRRGADDSEVAGSIAGCLWRGGKVDEALQVFDESLATNLRWYVAVDKAHCLARRDAAAALAWLQAQPLPPEQHLKALADFHRQRGELTAAIPALEAQLRQLGADRCFDDADQLVGFDLPLPNERHNELADLSDPLEELAECHFRLDQLDQAERCARRGVAVGRRIHESKGYYTPVEAEAGSVPCRLWLARVAMARQAWPEAAVHIEHARVLADRGSYTAHQREARAAAAELERRRTGR